MGCCGLNAQQTPATQIENMHWKLTWLPGVKIGSSTPPRAAYIELDSASHRMRGSGGCNTLMGGYELEGDHVKFMAPVRTMMACASGMATEDALIKALDETREWRVSGTKLNLLNAEGHAVARFVAAAQ